MASRKLAERKKNRRADKKRQQALKRREVATQDRKQRVIEYRVDQMMKPRQAPFRNAVDGDEVISSVNNRDEIMARLNHNLEILKALEEEYDKEVAVRQDRNQDLEERGCSSLKEKMDALHGEVLSLQKEEGLSFGGEADVVFTPASEISQAG